MPSTQKNNPKIYNRQFNKKPQIEPNFYFGTSLAAHQVEGKNQNSDWWNFEQTIQSKLGQNYLSNQGTDHFNRYKEDFKLAKSLNTNAHRFSIEWAKPEPGNFDQTTLSHYQNVLSEMRKNNLEPFLTLWHFTLPKWFADLGGFENPTNFHYFYRFAKLIAKTFSNKITYILTINEPTVYAYNSYLIGSWPPQKKSFIKFLKIQSNLAKIHNETYKIFKSINPNYKLSLAKNTQGFFPQSNNNLFDFLTTKSLNFLWNFNFLNKVKKQLDFIGVNYYFYRCVHFHPKHFHKFFNYPKPTAIKTDLNWEVYPEGIYEILQMLWEKYKLPLIITENGVADSKDQLRQNYLKSIFQQLLKSKQSGINLKGYFHWSLTDNFEWAEGFNPRFGLIEIDYKNNFQRKPRKSTEIYRSLIDEYSNLL